MIDDLFGFGYGVLIAVDDAEAGTGLIGTAASRPRVIVTANLARSRTLAAAVDASDGGPEIPLPGCPEPGAPRPCLFDRLGWHAAGSRLVRHGGAP